MYGYKLGLKKVGESVPAAPANVVQPSLVGNGAVGSVVTCNQGTWSGFPTPTFSYDFRIDSISVQSGASNTYTPLIGDDTKTLTCLVTATNSQGSASEGASNSLVVGRTPVNTVAPVISGTNTFGSTLTTTNGTFTGTATLIYTYQWLRGGSPIAGQTASTYVIGASDSLATITCEVTATNSYGFDSEVSNTITVANFAPVNTVAPTVSPSGTQSTGTLITASVGTWSGVAPITYEYKWTRNGVDISGATASTYTIQLADDGTTIRVEVKGTNTYGTSAFVASSNSVSAVNAVAPSNTVAPVISGTAVVGQALASTTGTWTGTPTPTYSYQWKRGATNIGTNSSTYTLVQADAGNTSNITCVVTATNSGGSANATSNQIAQILDANANEFNGRVTTAGGTLSSTEINAVNTLTIQMKLDGLWTKMVAVYPMVGSSAASCSQNLVSSSFTGTYSTGWTFANTGIKNSGASFFNTMFNTLSNMTQNNAHLSVYVRNNTSTGNSYDMGNGEASYITRATYLITRYSTNAAFIGFSDSSYGTTVASTDSRGFWIGATNGSTTQTLYRNGASIKTGTHTTTIMANNNLFLGAFNNGSAVNFTDKEYSFCTIGSGLSGVDASNFYNSVQAFQTTLTRQV